MTKIIQSHYNQKHVLKYTKAVFCGFHRAVVEVFCFIERWGYVISSRRFEEICRLNLLSYESIHGLIIPEIKAVRSFETSETNYLNTQRHNPEDMLPQYENKFATNKFFQLCVISSGNSARFTHDLAIPFNVVFFLSLSRFLHKRR
jgi:hypothetical protein